MITQGGKTFYSIEEIKNYINSQDSLGDVAYFLNDENIQKAQPGLDWDKEDTSNKADIK